MCAECLGKDVKRLLMLEEAKKRALQGLTQGARAVLKNGVVSDMPWYGSHSFLNEYIRANHCRRIMEIGVLNGDNAKNMIENATQNASHESVEYYGFDLFASYRRRQVAQKLEKMGYKFELFEGDSVETLPKAVKMLPKMDLIFIDGGKCFAEAQSDWQNSRTLMHDGTTVFVHNYEFPGVHKMVDNISRDKYQVSIVQTKSEGEIVLIKKRSSHSKDQRYVSS